MKLLDGKIIRDEILEKLKEKTQSFIREGNRAPSLAVILVGDDPASLSYVNSKHKMCEALSFVHFDYKLCEDTAEEELISLIDRLNCDEDVDAILVQLPLPSHMNESKVINRIRKSKDVDGFTENNLGRLVQGLDCFIPCTAKGILDMLDYYEIPTRGKSITVIGRSNIVGKPLAILLMNKGRDATVTVCNSHTRNLERFTKDADIIIVAAGKADLLSSSMTRDDAVIIDVGINRIKDESRKKGYRIQGDVDEKSFENTSCLVSPVPGGVGLMTVISLMENTFKAAVIRSKSEIHN